MSQRIVITGAFGALGAHVAAVAANAGANVALIDYAPEPSPAPSGALVRGGVDLGEPGAADAAIAAAAEALGGVDALFNIAGGFRWQTVEGGASDTWFSLFRINLLTCLNASRAAIPFLRRSSAGRIVNIGANGAVKAAAGMGAYAASKAGVHRLTESLAEELKSAGVTVNAVLPSTLDTPANRKEMPDADFSAWVPLDRLAAVMLFLASAEAADLTGALIPVTGRV